jgi:hypothetical protein
MLSTFADLYRQEVAAQEDVHRTLPFFGTALGLVIGTVAFSAGRLPKWADLTTRSGEAAFIAATSLLGLAIIEAACVLVFLSRAIGRQDYGRIGPEPVLLSRLGDLQAYYATQGQTQGDHDTELERDMQHVLLESYATVTARNRGLNQTGHRFRALSSSHLVRSLIWALGATTVIFIADKLGFLPKVNP